MWVQLENSVMVKTLDRGDYYAICSPLAEWESRKSHTPVQDSFYHQPSLAVWVSYALAATLNRL